MPIVGGRNAEGKSVAAGIPRLRTQADRIPSLRNRVGRDGRSCSLGVLGLRIGHERFRYNPVPARATGRCSSVGRATDS